MRCSFFGQNWVCKKECGAFILRVPSFDDDGGPSESHALSTTIMCVHSNRLACKV